MENASKALLIAGGVLLAMMVITIGVYLAGRLRNTSDTYVTTLDTTEIQKFNSKFIAYEGRTDITAQEIVTVISNVVEERLSIEITLENGIVEWESDLEQNRNGFMIENIGSLFQCTEIDYAENGMINKISFEKIL